ncbi:MAG TPA: GH25 family lysozyme [Thermoanaerobaculia bacterium]
MNGASSSARGIDVSKAQTTVNWPSVAGAGYVFAYIKATDGQDYVDPDFNVNWTGAAQAGLLRGAYHFFRAEDSPSVQANFFWNTVTGMGDGAGELPLVVDIEENMSQSNSVVLSNLIQFLQDLQQLSGRQPMIYTYASFWNGLGSGAFGNYPLWIAEYTTASAPKLPNGWTTWEFWQYSQSGQVSGITGDVDLDVFNGSADDLRQWAALRRG